MLNVIFSLLTVFFRLAVLLALVYSVKLLNLNWLVLMNKKRIKPFSTAHLGSVGFEIRGKLMEPQSVSPRGSLGGLE